MFSFPSRPTQPAPTRPRRRIVAATLPPPAGPGDRVGVAALSGPVAGETLEQGLDALRRLGFEPVVADNAWSRHGFFAGSDGDRLAAFHRLAADPDLPAILFTRGGHGLLRVLPGIDWELLRRRPRAYVGYSDLTPFLLGVVQRLGLVAFHGPLVAGELARGLSDGERDSLLAALAGRYPCSLPLGGVVRGAGAVAGGGGGGEGEGEVDIAGGAVGKGILLGGCLSLLTAVLGTPFAPNFDGGLLFWEDVNEPAYKLDRMLTHLSLSGSLEGIGGMVIGHLGTPRGPSTSPVPAAELVAPVLPPEEVADFFRAHPFAWPLAWGLESGHGSPNWTLPLGLPAHIDVAPTAPPGVSCRLVLG